MEANIEKGSTVITDGWTGYSFLAQSKDYKYEQKVIAESGKEAHELYRGKPFYRLMQQAV